MKKEVKILIIIFLLTVGFNLFFIFQTPNFSSDEAYFNIRHTEYINDNIKPIVYDELSYGGRTVINTHVFHYILAFFNIFLPNAITYKVIPILLLSSLVFIVFGISKTIIKSNNASLLVAGMAGMIPTLLSTTLNQVSTYSLVIPLIFYSVYCLLDL